MVLLLRVVVGFDRVCASTAVVELFGLNETLLVREVFGMTGESKSVVFVDFFFFFYYYCCLSPLCLEAVIGLTRSLSNLEEWDGEFT